MRANFVKERLQQARFLRGLTLAELGAATELTRQSLSLFENGERVPAPDTLERLALTLEVPIEFFLRPRGQTEACGRTLVHYRSKRRTREVLREQNKASAILDMAAATIDSFEEYVDYKDASLPALSADKDVLALTEDQIEDLAAAARKAFGIGNGPISDVSLLVENQAVVVVRAELTSGMDGLSAWYGERPFIVVSSNATYARDRTNVAHELGHLILHKELDHHGELDMETFNKVESQAWRFAGAFMLPANAFLSEVYSVSLDALVVLKKKWGVSVAAMIRRLRDLELIDDSQNKYLNIQLRQRGWHQREPGDELPRERSRLFYKTASFLSEDGHTTLPDLAARAKLPLDVFAAALEVDQSELRPHVIQDNVVPFKPKR